MEKFDDGSWEWKCRDETQEHPRGPRADPEDCGSALSGYVEIRHLMNEEVAWIQWDWPFLLGTTLLETGPLRRCGQVSTQMPPLWEKTLHPYNELNLRLYHRMIT